LLEPVGLLLGRVSCSVHVRGQDVGRIDLPTGCSAKLSSIAAHAH